MNVCSSRMAQRNTANIWIVDTAWVTDRMTELLDQDADMDKVSSH
jgi:hypothetical protein